MVVFCEHNDDPLGSTEAGYFLTDWVIITFSRRFQTMELVDIFIISFISLIPFKTLSRHPANSNMVLRNLMPLSVG